MKLAQTRSQTENDKHHPHQKKKKSLSFLNIEAKSLNKILANESSKNPEK